MNRRLFHRLVLLLALLVTGVLGTPAPSATFTTGDLTGVVQTTAGQPIPRATLRTIGGPQTLTARTDDEGKFTFADMDPGLYEVVAQKPGYTPVRKARVEVVANDTTELTYKLEWANNRSGAAEVLVQDLAGTALPGGQVELFQRNVFRTRIDADELGSVVFPGLSAGQYSVRVQRPGYQAGTARFTVRAGSTTEVAVRLRVDANQVGSLGGQVTDRQGEPVAGATVRILEGLTTGETATDVRGEYQFTRLIPGSTYVVQVAAPGFGTQTFSNIEVELSQRTLLSFRLVQTGPTRGSLSGTVTDSNGSPVALATVRITVGRGAGREVTTGPDGLYILSDLEPDEGYSIVAEKSGFAPAGRLNLEVVAGETTVENLVLRPRSVTLGTLAGVVREAVTGLLIPDVVVQVTDGPSSGMATLTDAVGRYELPDLAAGDGYTLRFSKDGYLPESVPFITVSSGGTRNVDAELEPVRTNVGGIRGTVKKPGGKAVDGATVTLYQGPTSPLTITTDDAGAYAFRNLEAGTGYALRFEKDGFVTQEKTGITVTEGEAVTVNFSVKLGNRIGGVEGKVGDLANRPIAGARVRVVSGPVTAPDVITDENGRFTYETLPRGVYTFEASANGYRNTQRRNVNVNPRKTTRVSIQMPRM